MTDDSYKIIISMSHHRVAYEYWQRDGENKLVGMPQGQWPEPLAFYCSDMGIVIGEDAAKAARAGTANAFEGYFERLKDDTTYNIGGHTRPIRHLFLDASESIFREFFRNVLFNRFGSLSDNRANLPLTLVCESDVKPNERALLQGLFKDSGYGRVRVLDYDKFISQYIQEKLSKEYVCDHVLVVWTEGSDLTFTLFDVNVSVPPKQATYIGLGADPRKEYVKKLIWERVVGQNPWLIREEEEGILEKVANDFLSSSIPLVSDKILLSDGQQYYYSLNRNSVDYIQGSDGLILKEKLEEFLRDNGIINRSRVLLLLRGAAAGNTYFEQNLSGGFSKTIRSDRKLRDNIMSLILTEEIPSVTPEIKISNDVEYGDILNPTLDLLKEKTKKWRQVRAEVNGKLRGGQREVALQILKDFQTECESISGANSLLQEIESEKGKIEISNSDSTIKRDFITETPKLTQPKDDSTIIKRLERKWREVRATASGKSRAGHIEEAKEIYKDFLKDLKVHSGTEALQQTVSFELVNLGSLKGKERETPLAPSSTMRPTLPKYEKETSSSNNSKGKELIAKGRLKDARDWYRAQNDTTQARRLSDIIRTQRGVEMRRNSLDECRKSKNKEQITRIVKELQEYIELCRQAEVDCSEYKKLLSDYKKI